MRQQLPKEIDPFRFAHSGRELEGRLSLADLPRLAELLHDTEGTVQVTMRFGIDATGVPYVQGHFEATLSLTCERCLQAMTVPLEIDSMLALIRHEKLAETLADHYDPWVVDETGIVNPATMVEDELILALPLVPRHDYDCLPAEAWFSGETDTAAQEPEKPASPFAVLSELKSKK